MRRWAARGTRSLQHAAPFAGLAVVGLALWVLHEALRDYRYGEWVAAFAALPSTAVALSLVLTGRATWCSPATTCSAFETSAGQWPHRALRQPRSWRGRWGTASAIR